MPEAGTTPNLERLKASVGEGGRTINLEFVAADGQTLKVAVDFNGYTTLLTHLVEIGNRAGGSKPNKPPKKRRPVGTNPIPVRQIGLANGKTPAQAVLTMRSDAYELSFGLTWQTLLRALKAVEARAKATPAKPAKSAVQLS